MSQFPPAIHQNTSGMQPAQAEPAPQRAQPSETKTPSPLHQLPPAAPAAPSPTSPAPSDVRAHYAATLASLHAEFQRTIHTAQRAAHDALATWESGEWPLMWALRDMHRFAALEQAVPATFDDLGAELGQRLAAAFAALEERAVEDARERERLRAEAETLRAAPRDEFRRRLHGLEAERDRERSELVKSVRALQTRLATAQDVLAGEKAARGAVERDLADAKQRVVFLEWTQKCLERRREEEQRLREEETRKREQAEIAKRAQDDEAARHAEKEKEAQFAARLKMEKTKTRRAQERKHTAALAECKAQHEATLEMCKAQHEATLEECKAQHEAAIEECKAQHEAEVQDLKAQLRRLEDVAEEQRRHHELLYEKEKEAHMKKAEQLETCRQQKENQAEDWAKERDTENRVKADLKRCLQSERDQGAAQKTDLERRLQNERDQAAAQKADLERRLRNERDQAAAQKADLERRLQNERDQAAAQKVGLERRLQSERDKAAAQKADFERRLRAQQQSPAPASARDAQKAQHRYAYDLVWNMQHGTLSFSKIPWPVPFPPKSPSELTEDAIKTYLLDPCAGTGGVPKKRIKDALLIFHPDKFEKFWSRMEEQDREMVKLGIDIVSKSLTRILAEVGR